MPDQTVTYRAKSLYVSKTFLTNAAIALLSILELRDVTNIIPAAWTQYVPATIGAINVLLRVYTVRPASPLLLPTQTAPMAVEKLK